MCYILVVGMSIFQISYTFIHFTQKLAYESGKWSYKLFSFVPSSTELHTTFGQNILDFFKIMK